MARGAFTAAGDGEEGLDHEIVAQHVRGASRNCGRQNTLPLLDVLGRDQLQSGRLARTCQPPQ